MSSHSHYGQILEERAGSISNPRFVSKLSCKSSGQTGLSEHSKPIPWNDDSKFMAKYMSAIMVQQYYKGVTWKFKPPIDLPDPWRCELYRFYLSMCSYLDATEQKYQRIERLCEIFTWGPEGIEYMKKLRSYAVVLNNGGHFTEEPQESDIVKEALSLKTTDVGDILNVRFWFFWDQPPDHDYKWCFEPLPKVPAPVYENFRATVEALLPDIIIEPVHEEEILLTNSGSSSRSNVKSKSRPVYEAKVEENYFSDKPMIGHMSYIQKCPGDTRYSVTLSVPHSNSVKLIEKQVAVIAAECPWSNYVRDENKYFKRYRSFKDSSNSFYCRDMRKDGLTKNRKLIQIILAEIKKKYPELPCNKYFSIYDDWSYVLEGEQYFPPRGIGLGMSSAITTILQSAIMRINLDVLSESWVEGSVNAIFYHDDAAFGGDNEGILTEFVEIDIETVQSLGGLVNKRKGFIGPFFVLCENYSEDNIDEKKSYQYNLLRSIHASENITHAKSQMLGLLRYIERSSWYHYMDELIDHFGYEFYPTEHMYPASMGGWVPASYMSIDTSFMFVPRDNKEIQAASLVKDPVLKLKHRRKTEKYEPPIKKIFPRVTNFGESGKDYDIGMTFNDMITKYRPIKRYGETRGYWSYVHEGRRRSFEENKRNELLHIDEWYELYHNRNQKDVYPPLELLVLEDVECYRETEALYKPENPYMSFLKFHNPESLPDTIMPWPIPPSLNVNKNLQLTAFERRQAQDLVTTFYDYSQSTGELPLCIPQCRVIPTQEWYNPLHVIAFTMALNKGEYLPKGLPRKVLTDVYLHKEIFIKVNNHGGIPLIPYLAQRLGYERVKDLDTYAFLEAAETRIRQVQANKLLQVYKQVVNDFNAETIEEEDGPAEETQGSTNSQFTWISDELHDEDFFNWQTSGRNYKNWRNHYFGNIDSVVTYLENIYYLNSKDEIDLERGTLGLVETHLWLRSGGLIDERGIPVLDRMDEGLGEDPDSDPGIEPNGSESSGSGLMAGW